MGGSRCDEATRGRDVACDLSKQLCAVGGGEKSALRCEEGRLKCNTMQERVVEVCNPGISTPR